jgi:hypothetical protein
MVDSLGLNPDSSLGEPPDHPVEPLSPTLRKGREAIGYGLVCRIKAVAEKMDGLAVYLNAQLDSAYQLNSATARCLASGVEPRRRVVIRHGQHLHVVRRRPLHQRAGR